VAFANAEERLLGLIRKVPYLTETRLRENGAEYRRGRVFGPCSVVDGRLITGQNPGSTRVTAENVVTALAAG
jgi:putative intracellular protease/amidase